MPRGSRIVQRGSPWPDDRTQRLRTLFAMGKGDAEIAHFLGVSVGAVVGKRLRLKLIRGTPGRGGGDAYEMAIRRAEKQRAKV